ncbi:hypothetical protein [Corynebacterium bovis]|nr:hypothetical protein [Corynebacterium bovis]MBB3116946.1 hypothetical protein [Corynebacterium bovis DSM 20582 = CIP 54.80]MBB3116961.1 hypothetical protein [Corynebacterium bovis DSM 20582 = CIP 54.80]MDN8578286.1 hypothetical protein [Corynebacterium bovis]QQC48625.1 hypothetical protein I6I09_10920 [Corynebacterium bovis]
MRTEKIVSEVGAPWVGNVVGFAVIGAASAAPWQGALVGMLTGPVPMIAILWMVRRGSVVDHHASRLDQRNVVFAVLLACTAAGGTVLSGEGARTGLWLLWVAALYALVMLWAVTALARFKISVHVAVWTTHVIVLAMVISPWWGLSAMVVPIVAWARVKVGAHTRSEVIAGAVCGLMSVGAAAVALSGV